MKQILNNKNIYDLATKINKNFKDYNQYLPVKITFYFQKNKKLLINLAQDIEIMKNSIFQKYGILDEEKTFFKIPEENTNIVYKELNDLFSIEQEVEIYKVNIEDFGNDVLLTPDQMEALMFMIND